MSRTHLLAFCAASALLLAGAPAFAEDNGGPQPPPPCPSPFGSGAPSTPTGGTITLPTTYPMPVGTIPAPPGNPYAPTTTTYTCVNGTWIGTSTALEAGLLLTADVSSVSVPEGTAAHVTGSYTYAADAPVTLSASVGHAAALGDGTWTWSMTPDDGPSTQSVTITGTAGDSTATTAFDLTVSNVAPTVASVVPDVPIALVDQPVTFSGTATDPSAADTSAGFTWSGLAGTFDRCGSPTVSATATDKDGGTSARFLSSPVHVVAATFSAPLTGGARNLVRAGQVVPVRVSVGCGGSSAGGLSPTIRLVSGDVDPATDHDDPALVVPVANASGDSTGVMREEASSYLYNLRVPQATSGSLFTVRVSPWSGAGSVNVVLQVR